MDEIPLEKLDQKELELRELRAKVRKLEQDLAQPAFVRRAAPWLSLGTALGMLGSVFAFVWNEHKERVDTRLRIETAERDRAAAERRAKEERDAAAARADEARRIDFQNRTEAIAREAAKPFWENQLALYLKAAEAAATLATTEDPELQSRAKETFWMLYWGPLACVEDRTLKPADSNTVEAAMVAFGKALEDEVDQPNLRPLALAIAHRMREQTAPEFGLAKPKVEKPEKENAALKKTP